MNRSHWVKLYVDFDQPMALCRWCHDQTDAPYERGRLVVTALGDDQFGFDVVQRLVEVVILTIMQSNGTEVVAGQRR